jgi:ActR/RegA family two-component response regulator
VINQTAELTAAADALIAAGRPWEETKRIMKMAVAERAVERARGNVCRAARILKMHRNTLSRILEKSA